ncbi:MAG: dehalogenase [Dehalococcoidia bacterium]|nr:MAG: dehalogenase [Dehalococcoidia bacterium]
MWFFAGILLAVVLMLLVLWLRSRKIAVTWYEWIIAALGLVLLLVALQNYFASSAGYEPTAPGMFLLVFGLPGILLFAIAAVLVSRRQLRKHDIIK